MVQKVSDKSKPSFYEVREFGELLESVHDKKKIIGYEEVAMVLTSLLEYLYLKILLRVFSISFLYVAWKRNTRFFLASSFMKCDKSQIDFTFLT